MSSESEAPGYSSYETPWQVGSATRLQLLPQRGGGLVIVDRVIFQYGASPRSHDLRRGVC